MKNWHKNFIRRVKEETCCTHEEAVKIAGWVSEIKQTEYMSAHSDGYNEGYTRGKEK